MSNNITKVTVARMIKDRLEKIKGMVHDTGYLIPIEDEDELIDEIKTEIDSFKEFIDDVETSGLSYKIGDINVFNMPNTEYLGRMTVIAGKLTSHFIMSNKGGYEYTKDGSVIIFINVSGNRVPVMNYKYLVANNGAILDEPITFIIVSYVATGYEDKVRDMNLYPEIFNLVDYTVLSRDVNNPDFNDWDDLVNNFSIFGNKIKKTVTAIES